VVWTQRSMARALAVAYWTVPSLFCLALYWYGLLVWFQQDDFVWVGLRAQVHHWSDLWRVIFAPTQHGTFRPLSERVFFLAFHALFGLDSLPYRIWVFVTQFANLVLISAITRRVTGSRMAGFWAPIFWIANTALYTVMTWTCEYILVLCATSLLLAFYLLLRYIETGARRFYIWQWIVFLLGFGAMETNMVYPAIAASYTFVFAPKYFRKTLPLFAASAGYVIFHLLWVKPQVTGPYAPHIDFSILKTFYTYWQMAFEPENLRQLTRIPEQVGRLMAIAFMLLTTGFAIWMARRRQWLPLFFLAWFAIVLAPVLPLREHITKYYLTLPTIGLAMLAAYGLAYAWKSHGIWRIVAVTAAAGFFAIAIPVDWRATRWWYDRSIAIQNLVMGAMRARELHPGKTILIDGVDDYLFWGAFFDYGFHAVGVSDVFLVPGSESRIHNLPASRVEEFVMAPALTLHGIENGRLVVYRPGPELLKNITTVYGASVWNRLKSSTPRHIDMANPLVDYLLGPGWSPRDQGFRWMTKQATLRLGGPVAASDRLYVTGICPSEELSSGPLTMTLSADGRSLSPVQVTTGNTFFHFDFPLPPELSGKESMEISIAVDHTSQSPGKQNPRGLSVAFGVFDVRTPD
jgi:hypothetical protein